MDRHTFRPVERYTRVLGWAGLSSRSAGIMKLVCKIALTIILVIILWIFLPFWWERFDVTNDFTNDNLGLDSLPQVDEQTDAPPDIRGGGDDGSSNTLDTGDSGDIGRLLQTKVEAVRGYYEQNGCPLKEYAETFIEVAEKNGLDWRLLPAIAMQESSCGKYQKDFNPFGYGYRSFDSFTDAIVFVGSAIAGNDPRESAFHNTDGDTTAILWRYNGTVNPNYPAKVMWIMGEIERGVQTRIYDY